ncbi:CopG family transcriptional regulator [Candidatus Curtissbacteria bacterium RBG_13_35_7]|uniref:CopG family transcriptional regulator n=1 Tax=Candidatus Curtissbacteria bacterium RBG_13_35_7 TaxID=1797705 RepID=A0A1F5G0Y6_9BACT|nr:MAG: CopG family transcriptional regulator [Candidatus Curtissbacteria bacterium RBG_13_35_7]
MKRSIKYADEPIEARVIDDFLPSPENLILRERKKRVTLTLTEKSLDFFKNSAKKHGASYQAMIRRLIDYYVANQRGV